MAVFTFVLASAASAAAGEAESIEDGWASPPPLPFTQDVSPLLALYVSRPRAAVGGPSPISLDVSSRGASSLSPPNLRALVNGAEGLTSSEAVALAAAPGLPKNLSRKVVVTGVDAFVIKLELFEMLTADRIKPGNWRHFSTLLAVGAITAMAAAKNSDSTSSGAGEGAERPNLVVSKASVVSSVGDDESTTVSAEG